MAQDDEGGSASGCCSSPSQPTQIVVQSALQSQQGINRRAMLGTCQGVQLLSQQVYLRCPFWVRASALMQLVSTHRWNTLSSCVCTQKPQNLPVRHPAVLRPSLLFAPGSAPVCEECNRSRQQCSSRRAAGPRRHPDCGLPAAAVPGHPWSHQWMHVLLPAWQRQQNRHGVHR